MAEPVFLVGDEPISALDVNIQAQIIHNLLNTRVVGEARKLASRQIP